MECERLILEPDHGAMHDLEDVASLHVYPSSLAHSETGEPLVSVITRGVGNRLTLAQARELRDWLDAWLKLV